MGHFWWVFDGLVILIAIYLLRSNVKRGLTKVFVLNIGYIVAITLSALVAIGAAPLIYESSVETTNVSGVEKANTEAEFPRIFANAVNVERYGFTVEPQKVQGYLAEADNSGFVVKLYDYCNRRFGRTICGAAEFEQKMCTAFTNVYGRSLRSNLPGYVAKSFEQQMASDPSVMYQILGTYYNRNNTAKQSAKEIESMFAEQLTLELLGMFVYLCTFSVIMIIAALIAAMVKNTLFFNVTSASEKIYGFLLGIAETFALLILFTITVRLFVLLGHGEVLCFNDPTIAETKVFRMLYDNLSFLI